MKGRCKLKRYTIAILILLALFGCAGQQTATQQIAEQGGSALQVSKAAYLDARTWYNDAQEQFIRYLPAMSPEQKFEYNGLLDKCGAALDAWRAALMLGQAGTGTGGEPGEFRRIRQEIIDAGLMALAK